MILDTLIAVLAFFVTYFLYTGFYELTLASSQQVMNVPVVLPQYLRLLLLWPPLWISMLAFNGLYRSFRIRPFTEIVGDIVEMTFFSAFAFAALVFILKIEFVSRIFFVIFVGLASSFLIVEKWIIISIARHIRRKGYNFRRLLIVGTGPRARRFIQMIKANPEWGLKINGLIDDDPEMVGKDFFGIKTIGVLADIPRILQESVTDEVIFIVPRRWLERIQKSIAACEIQGVKTSVAADLFDLKIARVRQVNFNGFPLMSFETTFGREWQLFIKRIIDLVVSFLGLILFSPFLLIIAILIKVTTPGPVFFKQQRIGVNGRIFTLYKFRTMHFNAEEKLTELKHLNEMDGPVFKIKSDPRITAVGRILRKISIDEIPQLFNVLLGHMSLVGPRPPIPNEVDKYELWQRRRLSMRPGLTCLWQIGGRNKIRFDKWIELDLKYIDNWSLWLDLKILIQTIPVVLLGVGAS
jgi:exopolysaccharide biosynthesis polyprenyl glycosylphosphotransferase